MPFNDQIADITHADTNKHEITLAAMGLPNNVVKLHLGVTRISGTGVMQFYPGEGTRGVSVATGIAGHVAVIIVNERLQYKLSVANDDFDLFCLGYETQGRLLG